MNDQVDVEEGEEVSSYNAFDDLCKRKSGVRCPNTRQGRANLLLQRQIIFDDKSLPLCGDEVFSFEPNKSVNCRCGLTWVSGGSLCLKYGVGYPFQLADVQVVSQRLQDFHTIEVEQTGADVEGLTEAVAEELSQVADDTSTDMTIQSGQSLSEENPNALPEETS